MVLVLLPTENNKLTLQWKGPFEVQEGVNRIDYKVKVDGKIKIYHGNLLKRYFEREDDLKCAAIEAQMDMADVIVTDTEPEDSDFVIRDEDLLDLRPLGGDETYKDINISEHLICKQKKELQYLLCQYADIFTDRPDKTDLVQHSIETITRDPVKVKPYQVPYAMRDLIKQEVEAVLEPGITESLNSTYCSPVVI
ncbi:uncharacterized protein LOC111087153 [Limulus polyphemus]|uniref:Uncharacterized protein LOC111087153 n=1 Tax=Limulus polyphemus TaxID=6850 RepID=A0ABM1SY06_LIMPO|nr:uncharacterized protein LOC111087153 [Limulus polyphemus]